MSIGSAIGAGIGAVWGRAVVDAAEQRKAFDCREKMMVVSVLANDPDFIKGVNYAQDYIASRHKDINALTSDESVEPSYRSWKTFGFRKSDMTDSESNLIKKDAKEILSNVFLKSASGLKDREVAMTASHVVEEMSEELGMEYERGEATALVDGLKESQMYAMGFASHLDRIIHNLGDLDGRVCAVENARIARNSKPVMMSSHYNEVSDRYLPSALEQYGKQLSAVIEKQAMRDNDSSEPIAVDGAQAQAKLPAFAR